MGHPPSNCREGKRGLHSGRVLAVSWACDPFESMESRVGWYRVMAAARNHEVWVLHGGRASSETLSRYAAEVDPGAKIHFIEVKQEPLGTARDERWGLFWHRYRKWQTDVARQAVELHAEHQFHLIHQINLCSFREPGHLWSLGVPFIWGPLGGTHNLPWRFLSQCDFLGGCREVSRALVNGWQLRFSRRIRQAANSSTKLFAASRSAQRDLARRLGAESEVLLETGVNSTSDEPRQPPTPDRPFRLVWAGRHRAWKGLPLLLQALAQLPQDLTWQLRVLGVGESQDKWIRMARRLGVADRIEWKGWPSYAETLPHYTWADAFVFTSLRDTSGTGLLESIAAGTPIIGLDHQGAADIMTPDSAMPIAVSTPRQVISDLTRAIVTLASDPRLWISKSNAAKLRSKSFLWSHLASRMEDEYQQVLAANECLEPMSPAAALPGVIDADAKNNLLSASAALTT